MDKAINDSLLADSIKDAQRQVGRVDDLIQTASGLAATQDAMEAMLNLCRDLLLIVRLQQAEIAELKKPQ